MYKCLDCGEVFDTPKQGSDFKTEYFGKTVTHYISVCPNCGSDELDTAERCELCGEWHSGSLDYCAECEDIIHEYIDPVIDEIVKTFGYSRSTVIEAIRELII